MGLPLTFKQDRIVGLVVVLIAVLPILSLNCYSFFWLDDYVNLYRLRIEGCSVWSNMIRYYNNWDGRNLSIAGFWMFFSMKYLPAEFITLSYTILWFINIFIVLLIVQQELQLKITTYHWLVSYGVLSTLLFYCTTFINETVFWPGGGIYTSISTIGLLWVYCFNHIHEKESRSRADYLLLIVLGVIAGELSQNLSTGLIGFVLAKWLFNTSKSKGIYVYSLFAIIVGTTIISVAPGNFKRAAFQPDSFNFNVLFLIKKSFTFLRDYLSLSKKLIASLIILGSYCYVVFFKVSWSSFRNMVKAQPVLQFSKQCIPYVAASVCTLGAFLAVTGFICPRTAIFFQYFIIISLLVFFVFVFKHSQKRPQPSRWAVLLPLIVVGVIHLYSMSNILTVGKSVKRELDARDAIARSSTNRNKSIRFEAIKTKLPFCYRFDDFKADSAHWSNSIYARYYGLHDVTVLSGD